MALQAVGCFIPIYFQVILTTSVRQSGIAFLPIAIGYLFFAAVAGIALSVFGVYRPINAPAFGLAILGCGLLTLPEILILGGESQIPKTKSSICNPNNRRRFGLIGDAYMQGIMDGEVGPLKLL